MKPTSTDGVKNSTFFFTDAPFYYFDTIILIQRMQLLFKDITFRQPNEEMFYPCIR